jgi:hypothetical protein
MVVEREKYSENSNRSVNFLFNVLKVGTQLLSVNAGVRHAVQAVPKDSDFIGLRVIYPI